MTRDRLELLDYYTLLEIDGDATVDQIRHAFHRFALKFHPDNHMGSSAAKLARANQIFRRGAEAYRILSNAETRREYDRQLAEGRLRYLPEEGSIRARSKSSARRNAPVSPKARPFFTKAQQAIKAGDLQQARLNIRIALSHDPRNEELRAMKEKVESKLRK